MSELRFGVPGVLVEHCDSSQTALPPLIIHHRTSPKSAICSILSNSFLLLSAASECLLVLPARLKDNSEAVVPIGKPHVGRDLMQLPGLPLVYHIVYNSLQ